MVQSNAEEVKMSALAVFTCRPNSHPFQERNISLHEAVKIGRSVARARPAANNAIFDCKVLSRNHALLWYENGKFFLQDTKSSNGTFINNQRLSKGSEESAPREIFSGDIVQFGVDVMENSRRDPWDPSGNVDIITHGCIIASIQLFFPDGREAKASHSSPFSLAPIGATVQSQELYQLAQYLQEALHREQMLENKLASLQRLVANTQEASETGWQALIDEDRLLSRLEVLENQLQAYSKNQTEETLRQELVALQEDKYNYETTAKESLRKVLQEKLDAVRNLSELERSLSNTEDECAHLKEMCEVSQKELQELSKKHQEKLQEMAELQEKLEEAEKKHAEEMENVEKEKAELGAKLEEMVKQEGILSAQVESLQADNDFSNEQLTNLKSRMETVTEKTPEKNKEDSDEEMAEEMITTMTTSSVETCSNTIIQDTTTIQENTATVESKAVQVDLVNMMDLNLLQGTDEDDDDEAVEELREKLRETQDLIEQYKSQLLESETRVAESKLLVDKLQNQLEEAQLEVVSHMAKISSLEEQINESDMQLTRAVENAVADIKSQLSESRKQADNSNTLAFQLKDEINRLEHELETYREEADRRNIPNTSDATDVTNSNSISNHIDYSGTNHLKEEMDRLKELLGEARDAHKNSELEVEKYKGELEEVNRAAKRSLEETSALQTQTQVLQSQLTESSRLREAACLQGSATDSGTQTQPWDQLSKAESTAKEVKQQILQLRDRLLDEQETARVKQEDADRLRKGVDGENGTCETELDNLQKQLLDAQQAAKQSRNEAEQLRMRVAVLQEELDTTREAREYGKSSKSSGDDDANRTDEDKSVSDDEKSGVPSKPRGDFSTLKEECANLRKRIQDVEIEMKLSRRENAALQKDYGHLQDSYRELESLKEQLENKQQTWQINLTDAQKEAEQTKRELMEANDEIAALKDRCSQYHEELTLLKQELSDVHEEYEMLDYKSKTLAHCTMLPILMLVFAVIMALYPTLSAITATSNVT